MARKPLPQKEVRGLEVGHFNVGTWVNIASAATWILQPAGSPMRDVMEQEFKPHHAPLPKGLIETASILTTTNLTAKTQMVAVIPHSVASRYEQHGLLAILPYTIRHKLAAYGSIVQRHRPLSQAATHFLEWLHRGQRRQAKS